ncbi:MAG: RNA polymerase sigma factor [Candidatus Omnitrophica bacterium]|nr:RNA polymerase sigma factor [Candidatus Omnitrophota bacterium]
METLSSDILRRAAQGDIEAFEQVYRAYSPFVYNVALRMVEAREDAEEITQEVFLIVHRKLNSFMFRSSLKTWVYRITANCAINLLNKRAKDRKGRVDLDAALEHAAGPDDACRIIEHEDQGHRVRTLLSVLNPGERACVVLRHIEDLSYLQVARSLNVNLNTVRTRLKRAREKMLQFSKEVLVDGHG